MRTIAPKRGPADSHFINDLPLSWHALEDRACTRSSSTAPMLSSGWTCTACSPDADRLVADLITQITAARLPSYAMIIDVSRCPVQAQDMIAAMGDHLTKMRNARALAIVTGTTLVRLQVRRIFNQPFTRFATSYDHALAWVVSGIEPDGATTA